MEGVGTGTVCGADREVRRRARSGLSSHGHSITGEIGMAQRGTRLGRLAAGVGLGCVTLAAAQPCELVGTGWPGEPEHVEVLEWINLGDGGRLYAGFSGPNGGVWQFDGAGWSEVAGEQGRPASVLISFDDGGGPSLYSGSWQVRDGSAVARFDGERWESVGTLPASVLAMAVYDDGSGPALFAAGEFGLADGSSVARWDGTAWTAVGGGIDNIVLTMQVFDDGTGPALYAAGLFEIAGATPVTNIARWDGQSWSAVGEGLADYVQDLIVFDEGAGERLFALPGNPLDRHLMYRWSGVEWEGVGEPSFRGLSYGVTVHDDGRGPAIYTVGRTRRARMNGSFEDEIGPFRWDGSDWESYNLVDERWGARAIAGDGDGRLYIASKGPFAARCGDLNSARSVVRLSCFPDDCTIDLNCDGAADGGDLLEFLDLLPWSADVNNDGFGNFFDVVDFLRMVDAGCGDAR